MAARKMVGIRVSEEGLAAVDKIIAETEQKQAVVIRVLLGEALSNTIVRDRAIKRLLAMKEPM